MRTIKFRGKTTKGNWVCGFLSRHVGGEIYFITTDEKRNLIVNLDTVGQFTGLYDKDGKEIYEGDILGRKDGGPLLTVEFHHGAFGYEYCGEFYAWAGNHNFTFNPFDTDVDFCIVGNIYDNPELLK